MKVGQSPAIDSNPVLNVAKDGTVFYSNEAGEPLLHEWGVRLGEKLPLHIEILVKKAISGKGIEAIEIKTGKRVCFVVFRPLPEKECVNVYKFDISDRKNLEEKLRENKTQDKLNMELAEIIDAKAIQSLMNDFYRLVHIPMALFDLKGNILVSAGWQDICIIFRSINPETCKHCVDSDINLPKCVAPGEYKLYRCKNNMWGVVTPIMVEGQHIGNIFSGQFLLNNEPLDYELFRSHARKYGFNEEEYIAALEKVPKMSREAMDISMDFFMTFANMISQLSYSNIKLYQLLVERDVVVDALRESEKRERTRSEELTAVLDTVPVAVFIAHDPQALQITGNRLSYEWIHVPVGTNFSKSAPEGERPEMFDLFKDGVEIRPADMPSQMAAAGKEINDCELDIVSTDGEIRHVLGNARPLRDERGKPQGSVSAFIDITERKKAEEAIRLSNLYNRSLIETSLDPLITIGPDGKITDVNSSTEIITGCSRNELIGTDFSDYFTEPEKAREGYQCAFKEGLVRDYLLEIRHQDGHITPVLYNASVYRSENGKVIGVFAAARDITAIKKAEVKIQTLANAVESSNDAIVTKSLDGIITSWNHGAEKVYGYLVEEVLGKNVSILEPGSTKGETKHLIEKIKQGQRVQHYETLRMKKDGTLINVSVTLSPVFDSSGKLVAISTIARDITENKKAEEALKKTHDTLEEKVKERTAELQEAYNLVKESEARLAESQKIAHIGNWDWNIVTNEEYWSDELYHIFGLDSQFELNHKTFLNCIHPDDFDYVNNAINEALNGKPYYIDYRIILPDGEERIIYSEGIVIFDEKNTPLRMKGIVQDITERKKAEEALVNIENARKKEIHHRIKNNLQVISSLLDLQAEQFRNRENIKDSEVLEAFRESQDRVISMALIHEELYKGEEFETLNFSPYIQELAKNLLNTYRLGDTEINLSMDLEENIFFDMDTAVPLGIIVNELVSNSFKHAFPDRNNGNILIKLSREEKEEGMKSITDDFKSHNFILTVSDDGEGIPENLDIEDLDSLGFKLITSLVDQLDGKFELKRSNGTEFTMRFAVAENNNPDQIGLKSHNGKDEV